MPNHIFPLPYFEMFSWYILDVLDQNHEIMRFTLHKNKYKNIPFTRNIKIHFLLHQNLGAQNPIGKYLMRI